MTLHDFLDIALDLLMLIETIEARQDQVEQDIRKLDTLPVNDAMRSLTLQRLRNDLISANADISRAFTLLEKI